MYIVSSLIPRPFSMCACNGNEGGAWGLGHVHIISEWEYIKQLHYCKTSTDSLRCGLPLYSRLAPDRLLP